MTNKRSADGKLRNELGEFANDKAEPGVTLVDRRTPNRAAYVSEIDIEEAYDLAREALGGRDNDKSMSETAALVCVAATSPRIAAATQQDRVQTAQDVFNELDAEPFAEAASRPGFAADTVVKSLADMIPAWAAERGQEGTPTTPEEYDAAVRNTIPGLSDRDAAQLVSDFSSQPHGFRLSNLNVFGSRVERAAWAKSQIDRIPAPAGYPFLSVPPTVTISTIDMMLMNDFDRADPDEIARDLAHTGWGSVFIKHAVQDRIEQLRPELLSAGE